MFSAAVVGGTSGFGVVGGLEVQPVRLTIKTTTANELQRVHRHDEDMTVLSCLEMLRPHCDVSRPPIRDGHTIPR